MKVRGAIFVVACIVAGWSAAVSTKGAVTEEVSLNGEGWTFLPVRVPFYGYELDAPGRWKPSARSHAFIIDALSMPDNDWNEPTAVRVPMSWSSATSEPASLSASGDFPFPAFWQYVHRGVYEREFEVPAAWAGRRVKLAFESVNFRCWVYVNDGLVRTEEMAQRDFTHENKHPFDIDITDFVRAAPARNRLRVVVHDFTASFGGEFPNEDHPLTGITYPLGDRCDYYNKDRGWRNIDNGIIGDVTLRATPAIHVADVFVQTSVRASLLGAEITVRNDSDQPQRVRVLTRVAPWKGEQAVLTVDETPIIELAAGERRVVRVTQHWENPRLWWPHDPYLYDLMVELWSESERLHEERQRFGFREVEMVASADPDRRGFYFNGVRTRLFGESVEPTWKDGYTEGVGTSGLYLYNPEYWSALLNEAKRLNIRVVRPHRGMWVRQMFEIADEKGVLMIAESTINNGNHQGGIGTLENQRRAIRDMIRALRNHPSVVLWCLANESPYREEWADEARQHDLTRPYVATQTQPRNHPSPSLAAASASYAMGLCGYEPNIYRRHDQHWVEKPLYVYEDNACYDQPEDADRARSVRQGLAIFRGHRSSGYELVSTFYTWQKLYGQPDAPQERLMPIDWTAEELRQRGIRPPQARLPLLDPWTDRPGYRVLRPLADAEGPLDEHWQRSFAPVAVFDLAYDERPAFDGKPYAAPLVPRRTIAIHNDDLVEPSAPIVVEWRVRDLTSRGEISRGEIELTIPAGGMRQREIELEFGGRRDVEVTYFARQRGTVRFEETIRLSASAEREGSDAKAAATATAHAAGAELHVDGAAVELRGYRREAAPELPGGFALVAEPLATTAFVQFSPTLARDGYYHVFVHVAPGLSGIQRIEVRHDTLSTDLELDLSRPGWVRATITPLSMRGGALQNAIRFTAGGNAMRSIVSAIKLVRVETP